MVDPREHKLLIKTRFARRGIYWLPNLFTIMALCAGFYAIVQAMAGRYEHAAIAIFVALVLDGMDGRIARLTRTQSAFGAEIYEGGIANMRYSVSNTAEYGDFTRGPRVVSDQTKAEMKRILHEIQTGQFAREFILENRAGAPTLKAMRRIGQAHEVETVGQKLREMMPWITKNRLVDQRKN